MNSRANGSRKTDGFWRASARVLRDRRAVAVAGMLLALHIVLAMFVSLPLTPSVRISVSFITNVVTGHLFGPWMGMITGALGDILQFVIRPTGAYFPGWTLNAAIGGFVYGLMFYRRAPKEAGTAGESSTVHRSGLPVESGMLRKEAGADAAARKTAKETQKKRSASDYISAGIFALVLVFWCALPFLQVTEKAAVSSERVVQNSGSALAYLTGAAGETANSSPVTLAAAAAVCAAAGLVFRLLRRRILAVGV
ncbi:MAG: folate family ECF transporter S component, partial [Lachnospiraceae bacterium]|nr:folate family ECF transporter S component [Lachnospiraceae bacterium]